MNDYDDADARLRASVLRKVLAFTFRLWRRTPWLAVACAGTMLLATLTEVFAPLYAGRIIDAAAAATSAPPGRPSPSSPPWAPRWSFCATSAGGRSHP